MPEKKTKQSTTFYNIQWNENDNFIYIKLHINIYIYERKENQPVDNFNAASEIIYLWRTNIINRYFNDQLNENVNFL